MPDMDFNNPNSKYVFRCIAPDEVDKVLEFARVHFFDFMIPLGSTRKTNPEEDEDWINFFRGVINQGLDLSIIAVERDTGKIVGMRLNKVVKRNDPVPAKAVTLTSEKNNDIFVWFMRLIDSVDVFAMYPEVDCFGDMLGISVHSDYRNEGLATELYKRSFALMKAKGIRIGKVGFTNPYSRKAGNNLGFKTVISEKCNEIRNGKGQLIAPNAKEEDVFDYGVFDLDTMGEIV